MSFSLNVPHERLSLSGLQLDGFTPVTHEGERDARVKKLVKQLSRCASGTQDSGLITIMLRGLDDIELNLVELAIGELNFQQQRFEFAAADAIHFINKGKPLKGSGKVSVSTRGNRSERAPFATIVDSIIPRFNGEHLQVMMNFGRMHDDIDTLVHLSDVLRAEGVSITAAAMERHLHAIIRVKTVRRMRSDVWVSETELVRAVEMFPDSTIQIIQVLLERGSLDALEEIMNTTPAVSEGAL